MTICRRHPALGWLSLERPDTQKTHEILREHCQRAEALDRNHSGLPQSFIDWCWAEQLPSFMKVPFYRKQIEKHLQDLQEKSMRIHADIQRHVGGLIAEQSEVDAVRHQLAAIFEEES